MNFSQIKETCLYIQDLDRTEAFYQEKLGLKVIGREEGRHIFFKAGSSVLLCFIADATQNEKVLPVHYGKGKMHIAFEIPQENYRKVKAWIQTEGIEIEHEQHWFKDYHSFYFRDPDGHSLEIVPKGMWEEDEAGK